MCLDERRAKNPCRVGRAGCCAQPPVLCQCGAQWTWPWPGTVTSACGLPLSSSVPLVIPSTGAGGGMHAALRLPCLVPFSKGSVRRVCSVVRRAARFLLEDNCAGTGTRQIRVLRWSCCLLECPICHCSMQRLCHSLFSSIHLKRRRACWCAGRRLRYRSAVSHSLCLAPCGPQTS